MGTRALELCNDSKVERWKHAVNIPYDNTISSTNTPLDSLHNARARVHTPTMHRCLRSPQQTHQAALAAASVPLFMYIVYVRSPAILALKMQLPLEQNPRPLTPHVVTLCDTPRHTGKS